jgi:ATP-dependent Lhr-like helicase
MTLDAASLLQKTSLDETFLPETFLRWFAGRGWRPRAHQLELLARARAGRCVLLIAPTGGGKTLAGFLPTLVELSSHGKRGRAGQAVRERSRGRLMSAGGGNRDGALHTLYVSPLKALAVDIARNLEQPVAEMGLPIRIETRTGDTPASRRQRQRRDPPHILLTTPEQLALVLASPDAPYLFGSLKRVVLDELHALVTSKRGDLLALGLARLLALAPDLASVGLSATVAEPDDLRRFLVPQGPQQDTMADLVVAQGGAAPDVRMLASMRELPWAGHSAHHAIGEIYALIKHHKTTLIFVNTRGQAESIFQELWRANDDALAIALHHGSLDVAQRRKVEAAMAVGRLRAVACTSSLDLGVDWGDLDLVINVGAPKGASRLLQRIGRADFDAALDFVATGGYALKAYERFAKIRQNADGRWRVSNPTIAQRYRMNVGTIVEADMLKVRLVRSRASKMIARGGRLLGKVEEHFIETLVAGDTFVFAGEILRY